MTAEWQSLGIWDAYQRDFAERFATKPRLVRPSPLGFEHYYDAHVGQKGKGLPGGVRPRSALVLLGELRHRVVGQQGRLAGGGKHVLDRALMLG